MIETAKLPFPDKVLNQHLVMFGKTGAGKSSKLRVTVEHLFARGKRVCIVDPKGDWWGLKVAGDGRSPGMPFVLFGDFKNPDVRDVPINDQSGAQIAELIVSGNRPCVIGMRGWTNGAKTRFWIDFASTLFNRNSGELYLVVDEAHNFAPKQWKGRQSKDDNITMAVHWTNTLLSEARGLGIVCLLATQRPQKLHNDTASSCETLVALRVTHPRDREAVEDWIDGNGDPDVGKEVVASLAQMKREEGWVWSPDAEFGPKRVTFPMFQTFDSFAPPQLQRKVSGKGWADVDLTAVKEKLAAVIQEAEENDPKLLKQQLADLRQQLAARPKETKTVEVVKRVEVPVLKNGQLTRTEKIFGRFEDLGQKLLAEASQLRRLIEPAALPRTQPAPAAVAGTRTAAALPARSPAPTPTPAAVRTSSSSTAVAGDVDGGTRKILIALAQRDGLNNKQLGQRAGVSPNSSTFRGYLADARKNNWIRDEGALRYITDAGVAALGEYTPLPTGAALREHWYSKLGTDSGETSFLKVAVAAYPSSVSYTHLSEQTGTPETSSTFRGYLATLRKLELVSGKKPHIRASDELFDSPQPERK
jgi:hypothetical protein